MSLARGHEVLRALADGLSNAEIAKELFLSDGTVRNCVSSLFIKLGVNDRTQAAVVSMKN